MMKGDYLSARNRAKEDTITTVLGLMSAIALVMAEQGFYPRVSSVVSGVALALLGVFTNKPLR
jgi:hypothetical membrane protein